jgi:hypothetical protein
MMLVHKNENQVNRLVNHLSKDFDVYVHIDKNYSLKINTQNNVFVYKKYKTYWGSFNQIIATLYLLSEAHRKGYDRYILISGQDLPVKTNEEIRTFFENDGNEYIEVFKIPRNDRQHANPTIERITQYHGIKKSDIIIRLRRKINHLVGRDWLRPEDYVFYGGSNWTNYTKNCVEKILEYIKKDKKYIKRYKWTICADEIFYQTILHQLKGINIINDDLRYVDWETGPGYPRILQEEDYEKIIGSKALFARKFDENMDKEIMEKIYEKIGEKQMIVDGTHRKPPHFPKAG